MAEKFQRTFEVENERVNAPGSAAETAGLRVRFEQARYKAIQRGETPPTLEDLGTERLPILREDDKREALISALRGEAAGMAHLTIAEQPVLSVAGLAEAASLLVAVDGVTEASEKRELTPEDAHATLATLETRFYSLEHKALHKGVEWTRVKSALEANPEALWSVNKLQAAGHDPDVYDFDEEGFDIGTCSKESPESGRNCVYGKENAKWLRESKLGEQLNGSAEEMAEAMGISLMDGFKYRDVLQSKGKFDLKTWSWLLTPKEISSTGYALRGSRDDSEVRVSKRDAYDYYVYRAWRGSLRVKWAA